MTIIIVSASVAIGGALILGAKWVSECIHVAFTRDWDEDDAD